MGHLDLLKAFYQTVWIDGDVNAIDRFFVPQTEAHGILADGQVGPADFKAIVPAFLAQMRDLAVQFDRSVEMGEWLWAHVTARALAPGSNQTVSAGGMVMMRVENGRIAEAYNSFDFLTFFEQVGLLPRDCLMLLLSGEHLALASGGH